MAGETHIKTVDELPYVTLPMTGAEHIPVFQGSAMKRMHPGDFPAVIEGYVKLDGTTAFQGDQPMGGKRLTDLAAPVNDNDATRFKDLNDRTGWVKVIPLLIEPTIWETNSLYLIQKVGFVQAYLTDSAGVASSIGNTVDVVNKINNITGAVTVGIDFTGGKASIKIGNNTPVNLDARYLQLADYDAPALIPNDIETNATGAASAVIADATSLYVIDPAALVASMTCQLPENPVNSQTVKIKFGGTIKTGAVITAFTLTAAVGDTIFLNPASSAIVCSVSDVFVFQYYDSKWFRLDKDGGTGGLATTGWTVGDLFYADVSGNIQPLAKGSDGNVLELGSGLPFWNGVNAANQLLRLDGTGKLPALDASQLINLPFVGWTVGGNTIGAIGSLGTLDNYDFKIIRNNQDKIQFTANEIIFKNATRVTLSDGFFYDTGYGSPYIQNITGSFGLTFKSYYGSNSFRTGEGSSSYFYGLVDFGRGICSPRIRNVGPNQYIFGTDRSGTESNTTDAFFDIVAGGYAPSQPVHSNQDIRIYTINAANGKCGNIILAYNGTTQLGRVGIGLEIPNVSALLDVSSTTKGFLPPRMTTTNWGMIASKAEGLQGWSNDDHGQLWFDGTRTIGFRYNGTAFQGYNGTTWIGLCAWGGITGTLSDQTDLQSALNAKITGSGTAKITVGITAPASPGVGDIWVDTN